MPNDPYRVNRHSGATYTNPWNSITTPLNQLVDRVKQQNQRQAIEASRRGADPYAPLTALSNLSSGFQNLARDEFGVGEMAQGIRERDPVKFAEGLGWGALGASGLVGTSIKGGKMALNATLLENSALDDAAREVWDLGKKGYQAVKNFLPGGAVVAATQPSEAEGGTKVDAVEALVDWYTKKKRGDVKDVAPIGQEKNRRLTDMYVYARNEDVANNSEFLDAAKDLAMLGKYGPDELLDAILYLEELKK